MPQRAANILIALAGAAAVVALILVGLDAARSARTGPAWKRRLFAAGLALLAALGAPGCGDEAKPSQPTDAEIIASIKDTPLAETEPWKQLSAAWAEAQQIATDHRGEFPFNKEGKQRMLDSLAAARRNAELLDDAGLLSVNEAELLARGFSDLTKEISACLATDETGPTCYVISFEGVVRDSVARLADRLPLLEWLANEGIVKPDVTEKILATLALDVAALTNPETLETLPEGERAAAQQVGGKAAACVARLRAKLAEAATQPTTVPAKRVQ